jgi:cell division protein FtsB
MAKNRKYQSASIRFGPALKALLLCLVIGGSGIGYVWQKNQIYQLGKQYTQREKRLKDLQTENKTLSDQLDTLRSPVKLEARVRELNLGLTRPNPSQVICLPESAPPIAAPGAPLLAQQAPRWGGDDR